MKAFLLFLITLIVSSPTWANTLRLEFAQEGEPSVPRALIVIHNSFEDRSSLSPFFKAWASLSWTRDQYCSIYSYEYDGNGLRDLASPEALSRDLYAKIRSNDFNTGRADDANPNRRTSVADDRQPRPSFKSENLELLLAGNGYGGVVAREVALLAKKDNIKVTRVAYVGTPLDGLSTIDLILAFSVPERAKLLGLSQALDAQGLNNLSQNWWALPELHDRFGDWATYFAPAYQETKMMAAYGTQKQLRHPTDNVLYGRHRRLLNDGKAGDGFVPQPSAWGKITGPITWLSETTLENVGHADLSEKSAPFLLKELIDREVTFEYLVRRQGIEEYFRGPDPEAEPMGTYYDERDTNGYQPTWRNAYARAAELYKFMWGVE